MKKKLLLITFSLTVFFGKSQSISIDPSTPFAALKNSNIVVNFNPPVGLTGPFTVDLMEFQEASTPYGPTSNLSKKTTVTTNTNSVSLPIGNYYTRYESNGYGGGANYTHFLRVYAGDYDNVNLNYAINIRNVSKPILGLRKITNSYPSAASLKIDMANGDLDPSNTFTVKLFRNGIGTVLPAIYQPGARVGLKTNAINSFVVTLPTGLANGNNYYIEVTSSSPLDSEITNFFTIDNSIPLPINLINFDAKTTISGNQLNWKTSDEKNFSHFEIERSSEGAVFDTIGKLVAIGNSSELNEYQFIDNNLKTNNNYYRLKQIDLDGKFDYSKILFVKTNAESNQIVYPNPAIDYVSIENMDGKIMTIRLIDNFGRAVISQVTSTESIIKLPINDLKPGSYFIQIENQNQMISQKIIKR